MHLRHSIFAICLLVAPPLAKANSRKTPFRVVERFPLIKQRPTQAGPYRIVTPENGARVKGLMRRREKAAKDHFKAKTRGSAPSANEPNRLTEAEYTKNFPPEKTHLTRRTQKPILTLIEGRAPQRTSFLPERPSSGQQSGKPMDPQAHQQALHRGSPRSSDQQRRMPKDVFDYSKFRKPRVTNENNTNPKIDSRMSSAAYQKALRAIDRLPADQRRAALDELNGLTKVKNTNGRSRLTLNKASKRNSEDYTERLTKVIEDKLGSGVKSFRIFQPEGDVVSASEIQKARTVEVQRIVSWRKLTGDYEVEIALDNDQRIRVLGTSLIIKNIGESGFFFDSDNLVKINDVAEITSF